jgi:hypothetical protein
MELVAFLNAVEFGFALVGIFVWSQWASRRFCEWWWPRPAPPPPPPEPNRLRITAEGVVGVEFMKKGRALIVEVDADVMENITRLGGGFRLDLRPEMLPQPIGRLEQLEREKAELAAKPAGQVHDRIAAIDAEIARLRQSLN